jgi:hypothetical protein
MLRDAKLQGFQVHMTANMQMAALWDDALCNLVDVLTVCIIRAIVRHSASLKR